MTLRAKEALTALFATLATLTAAGGSLAIEPPGAPKLKPDFSSLERARGELPPMRLSPWSGYEVPRFVSLKGERAFCRIGPSLEHPVRYEFQRKGLPLLVVAETRDKWRKVRDVDGDECWAFHTTLTARNHALALRSTTAFARRRFGVGVRGRIEEGALVEVTRVASGEDGSLWAFVVAGPLRGWAPASHFWGADVEAERERRGADLVERPLAAYAAAPN